MIRSDVVAFCAIALYYLSILQCGTTNPYFVLTRTASAPLPWQLIPEDVNWRPQERVVVSLTTQPERLSSPAFRSVLHSIVAQSLAVDAIYLSLPPSCKENASASLAEIANLPKAVTVLKTNDSIGSLANLLPVLSVETDLDTIIIAIEDNSFLHHDLFRLLSRNAISRPGIAHGQCGWGFLWTWPTGAYATALNFLFL